MPGPGVVRGCLSALTALLLVGMLVAAGLAPAADAHREVDEDDLAQARRQIEAVKAELGQAQTTKAKASERLAAAEAQLRRLEHAVNDAARALDHQQAVVDEAADRIRGLEARLTRLRSDFSQRAVNLYKQGVGAPFAAVLGAGSIDAAIARSAYVQAISSSDRAILERVAATRTLVDAERERLKSGRARLARMKAEKEKLLAEVAAIRDRRALKLAAARNRVEDLEHQKEDLEAESRQITELLKERERAAEQQVPTPEVPAPDVGDVSTSGFIWPRCDSVTSEYGYRWGRRHEGIDIDGETGDPIYAAKAGEVIHTGWYGGYGQMTLIDHDGGIVTGYAHQSAIAVDTGQRVDQGERIGSVGSTGNSTGSHLHFETRVDGSPVDPRQFLPTSC